MYFGFGENQVNSEHPPAPPRLEFFFIKLKVLIYALHKTQDRHKIRVSSDFNDKKHQKVFRSPTHQGWRNIDISISYWYYLDGRVTLSQDVSSRRRIHPSRDSVSQRIHQSKQILKSTPTNDNAGNKSTANEVLSFRSVTTNHRTLPRSLSTDIEPVGLYSANKRIDAVFSGNDRRAGVSLANMSVHKSIDVQSNPLLDFRKDDLMNSANF